MWNVESDGSLQLLQDGAGPSTETALDLHWENTEGVLRRVDNLPQLHPYLQFLNLEGQRVADISALGSLMSLRELIASGNQLVDISPLSSCLLLTKLDLSDNLIEDIPVSFQSLMVLQQMFVAGNRISTLTSFEALAMLPALVEISVERNPVADLANCEAHLIAQLRQLKVIDGKPISQSERQSAAIQAANRRLELLEEQIMLQDTNIAEVGMFQQRSEGLLQGIERLMSPVLELPSAPVISSESQLQNAVHSHVSDHGQKHKSESAVNCYLPVMVAGDELHLDNKPRARDRGGDFGDLGTRQRGLVNNEKILEPKGTASRQVSADLTICTSPLASAEVEPSSRSWQQHFQLQTEAHTQTNLSETAFGKLPAASGDGRESDGSLAEHASQLTRLLAKSRDLLISYPQDAATPQRSRSLDPPATVSNNHVGEGQDELRGLVHELLVVAMPVFDSMQPPFNRAFQLEDMGSYTAEHVVRVFIALLPHLSASAFPRAPSPTPATPQPHRAPVPQSALPHQLDYRNAAKPPAHLQAQPVRTPNAHTHQSSGRREGPVNGGPVGKSVQFRTPQFVADTSHAFQRYRPPADLPWCHELQPHQHTPDLRPSNPPCTPGPARELHPEHYQAHTYYSSGHHHQQTGPDEILWAGHPGNISLPFAADDVFRAQASLARAAATAAAAEEELKAARLRAWGVGDMSRREVSVMVGQQTSPPPSRESGGGNMHYQSPTLWRPNAAPPAPMPASAHRSSRGSALHPSARSPSPLALEIESRYQQYRRAMQEYDDAVQQANATAEVQMSAVAPSYFQHTSLRDFPMEAEDYFELDSEKMLLGISPTKEGAGKARIGSVAARAPSRVLNTGSAPAKHLKVPPSERFDRDSCHRPVIKVVVPAKHVPGLELLRRKGGKGVKTTVSTNR